MPFNMEFNFDDSIFLSQSKSTQNVKLISYNAKICSPLWFEETSQCDEEGEITRLKFSADYHYVTGDYRTAVEKYKHILDSLPSGGMSMKRDVMESLSRCYLKLDLLDSALTVAQQLSEQGTNEDHEVQALSLLQELYQKVGKFSDSVDAVQRLIAIHPHHFPFWLGLARTYENLRSGDDTLLGVKSDNRVKVFSCYLRTKLLLQLSEKYSGSFLKQKHANKLQQISEELQKFSDFSESEKTEAERFLSRDLPQNLSGEDDVIQEQTHSASLPDDSQSFNCHWFSWANNRSASDEITDCSPT